MNKILIIDDEPPIRKMLKKRLERNSYQVWEADNGRQGLELYREHDPNQFKAYSFFQAGKE